MFIFSILIPLLFIIISLVSKLSSLDSDFLKLKADFVVGQNNWKYLIILSTLVNAQVLRFSTFTFRLSGKHDSMWFSLYRPLKGSPCLGQEDVNINETSFSELRTKREAWQFYQFKTQHPLDEWTARSLPNLYFTDMLLELRTHTVCCIVTRILACRNETLNIVFFVVFLIVSAIIIFK